jgi:TonB family protein
MTYAKRLGICAVASLASHFLLARGTAHLPARVEAAQPVILSVNLRQAEPEPEPEPVKPQGEEPSKQPVHEAPAKRIHRVADATKQATPTKNITPTERPATTDSNSDTPVFGISMESTSAAGTGPSVRVGNTLQTKPRDHEGPAEAGGFRPLAAPVPAYQVTKMPLPKGGSCPPGPYTNEAREAGLEGIVILSFVVDENGRVRDIKVLQGLGMGLTEQAKRAVQACAFSPGERDGKPVPTRVSSFKIRFNLRENE